MINIAIYALLVFEVIVCFLLLAVILVQRSKSQGAGGMAFGAGMGETMFGSQVGNVLTRSTVILGVAFLVITTALAYLTPRAGTRGATDLAPDVEPAPQQPEQPVMPVGSDAAAPDSSSFPSPLAPLSGDELDSSDIAPPADAPAADSVSPLDAIAPADIQPVEIPAVAPVAPVEPAAAPVGVSEEAVPEAPAAN